MLFRALLILFLIILVIRFFKSFAHLGGTSTQKKTHYNSAKSRKVGDVTITKVQTETDKKFSKEEGEYIDYEDA